MPSIRLTVSPPLAMIEARISKNLDLRQSHSSVLNITRSIRMSILGRTVIQTDRVNPALDSKYNSDEKVM
jgi:hypothetical protein